jgi:CubicO group peptidase (beta-lactamase class C family)
MYESRPYLVVAALWLLLPVGGTSQEPAAVGSPATQSLSETIARIDSTLAAAASRGMNGVVHIRVADEVLLHRAYGWRDRESADSMTTADGFDIGSLVKPLTAVAVLEAEEEGLLSTEDTLGEYFPDAPEEKLGITIGQLLRHRAGFQDYIGRDYELISRSEALQRILTAPLEHPPGTERAYSNSGYTLLAIILEEATGRSYEAYVREAVLEQLEDVGPALDDDDRVAVADAGTGREPLVLRDVLDADRLPDLLYQVRAAGDLALEVREQVRRALDDLAALGRADVLDGFDVDGRPAGPDAVDDFERRREDGRLDLIQ